MIKRSIFIPLLAGLLALGATRAAAQGQVDIGLYRSGPELEVRVRPAEDFTGIVSAIVFTIRWERNADARLTFVQQKSAPATYIPVVPSGDVHQVGNHNYQVYAGFGFDLVSSTEDHAWEAGKEYTIARIPVEGDANFELLNDEWTGVHENNADFFISLNGEDRTGTIYKGLAPGGAAAQWVSVLPNPNNGQFTFTVEVPEAADLVVEVLNTLGQVVYTESRNGFSGSYRRDMDVRGMGAGAYQLRIIRNGHTDVHTVIVQP